MRNPSPIIVIGAARSGTKFLRDVLAVAKDTAVVPYDVNYVWRYGAETEPDDVLDPEALTEKRLSFIRSNLRNLANANQEDVLIEKTVANSLRVPFVEAVFPNARYVHIIRDGRDVVESAMRQWQTPPNWRDLAKKLQGMPFKNIGYAFWFSANILKGIVLGRKGGKVWGPRFRGIDEIVETGSLALICAMQWQQSVTNATKDLSDIKDSKDRVFTIKYETLISDSAAITELIQQLKLSSPDIILANFHQKLRPSEPKMWQELPKNDVAVFNELLEPTLKKFGYTI
jgi:hypothetical protein